MDFIDPRPTEGDKAIVTEPDSVTHFVCPSAPHPGWTHLMLASGRCRYCQAAASHLRERYGL